MIRELSYVCHSCCLKLALLQLTLFSAVALGSDRFSVEYSEPTEIRKIVKDLSPKLGLNILVDKNVSGKVQIISPQPVSRDIAYQILLSALDAAGLTTVETGAVVKIIKQNQGIKENLAVFGDVSLPQSDQVVTQVFPLKYLSASEASRSVMKLLPSGAIRAFDQVNALILNSSASRLRRVVQVLKLLDRKQDGASPEFIQLRHIPAGDALPHVKALIKHFEKNAKTSQRSLVLADEVHNRIIFVGQKKFLNPIKKLISDLDRGDVSASSKIHYRPLDFMDAKEMASLLSVLRQKNDRGGDREFNVVIDESTNSLLITGSDHAYKTLSSVIRKLDLQRPQIFLEVYILDIDENHGFQFGTSGFGGAAKASGEGTKVITGWQGADAASLVVSGIDPNNASSTTASQAMQPFQSDLTVGILTGRSVEVAGIGKVSPKALLKMIRSDRHTKVLSSPYILTADNHEAELGVGDTVFYRSSNVGTDGSVVGKAEKEKVDMSIKVKPHISFSEYVTLDFALESNLLVGAQEGIPLTSNRKLKQTLTVRNKQTVVIGGLESNRRVSSVARVPLLSEIPFLGYLFTKRRRDLRKTSVTVLITPHIVRGADDLKEIYKSRSNLKAHSIGRLRGKDHG